METKPRTKRKTTRAQPKSVSEEEGHSEPEEVKKDISDSPQTAEAEMPVAISATATPDSGTEAQPMTDDIEVSDESSNIIAIIEDLQSELDVTYELKEALEADLATQQKKLSEEESVSAELETRVKLLEAKAALVEQLREEMSFVEEERNTITRRLEEVTATLEQVTQERDSLAEQKVVHETRLEEFQNDKIALEAKILNLEETVTDMDRLGQELAKAEESSRVLDEKVQNLQGTLEAAEASKSALELDLATARERVRDQDGQIEELRNGLTTSHAELADLCAQLEQQERENLRLREGTERSAHEMQALTARHESMKKELEASKKALHAIRTAALRTTSRLREHPI
jgi:chromosome segregation ATPase